MIGLITGSSASPSSRVARGDVERRDLRLRERVGEHADDPRAHRVVEFVEPEMIVGARDFLQELLHVDDAEIVRAVGAQAHDAEVLVAHHHRIGRAPLVAGEQRA